MLHFFRSFFQSKLGVGITLAFLGIIAFAFASADVSNSGAFGGIAGGNRVASVGDEKISTAALNQQATNALEQVRQDNPNETMQSFIAQGGLEQIVSGMIDRLAIAVFGEKYGLRAGDNLVNSEIIGIPAFQGATGQFDEKVYRQLISQRGLTDKTVRDDLRQGLLARQVLVPASFGATAPAELANRYAALFNERRQGGIGIVPSAIFAPKSDPTAQQLSAFYAANRDRYIRPERRRIRYALFGANAIKGQREPTANEIAARYKKDATKYAASETRTVTQLVVPTQAAAKAVHDRVAGGTPLAAAAREAGLATVSVGPLDKPAFAAQTSAAVADAVFAAAQGGLASPARGSLGWYVARVDRIDRTSARSLDQVRGEIGKTLREEGQRNALAELGTSVEDQIDDGSSLTDLSKSLGSTVLTTPPVTANGAIYGSQGSAPPELARVLSTAFAMEQEGEPQVAEIEPGKTYMIFDVADITASAAAPLAEIKPDVIAAWKLEQGSKAAKAAADAILARVAKGEALSSAMKSTTAPLPPIEAINLSRPELTAQGGRVPPALALLFSMAQGTVKRLAAPDNNGWFVVALDKIQAGKVDPKNPILAQARTELGQIAGREYAEQLQGAIRKDVGVSRNAAAIKAVATQLTGGQN